MAFGHTRTLVTIVWVEHPTTQNGVVTAWTIAGQQVQVNVVNPVGSCMKIHQIDKFGQQNVPVDKVIDPLVGRATVNVTWMHVFLGTTEKHLKVFCIDRLDRLVPRVGRDPACAEFSRIIGFVFQSLVLKRMQAQIKIVAQQDLFIGSITSMRTNHVGERVGSIDTRIVGLRDIAVCTRI